MERFKRYLETDLRPHLNGNSVLVMDNMKSHHAKAVRNLLDCSGWFHSCGYSCIAVEESQLLFRRITTCKIG